MGRDRLIVVAAFAAFLALLFAADRLQRGPLHDLRADLQLTVTQDVNENLPPEIAFTYAIGSFRGLAVDVLWSRAWNLKQEGQYYELMQLSDWITRLQPRFPKVWEFHAHNLSYNLADAVQTEQEAWMWVQAGIRLLRDQGIPLNPRAVALYEQLGYIYLDRVGKFSAEMHWYFKREHAREWHYLLGPPPEGASDEVRAWFRPIAQAPASLAELLRRHPEVSERLAKLKELGFGLDFRLLETVVRLQDLRAALDPSLPAPAEQQEPDADREFLTALDGPAGAELLAFARAKLLREQYRMDPAFMMELMDAFGPLDWRLPYSHAVYWAALGTRRVESLKGVDLYDVVQTDRIVLHGLQALAFGGKLYFDPRSGYYNFVPDPRLFDAFEKAAAEAARRQNSPDASPRELAETHRGFLIWATQRAYVYAGPEKAGEYYRKLREIYGARDEFRGLYTKPLNEFVQEEMTKSIKLVEQAQQIIAGLAFTGYANGLAQNRPDVARRFFALAEAARDKYHEEEKQRSVTHDASRQRAELLPVKFLKADALRQFMLAPPSAVPLRYKLRAWNGEEDLEIRRLLFDRLRPALYAQAKAAGYDPARAFPEPPGMDEFRRRRLQGPPIAPPAPGPGEVRPEAQRK